MDGRHPEAIRIAATSLTDPATMGYNAELRTVLIVLTALEHVLRSFYARVPRGAGVEEARRVYGRTPS